MANHPTRDVLLDTVVELAEQSGLAQMSINDIVRAAGVAKGTFYVHFADRAQMLVAMHQRFYDAVIASIATAIDGMAPGKDRLVVAANAYLDASLNARGVKAVLIEGRSELALTAEIARRDRELSQVASPNFARLGFTNPDSAARLYLAMVATAAIVELEYGHRHEPTRATISEYLCTGHRKRRLT